MKMPGQAVAVTSLGWTLGKALERPCQEQSAPGKEHININSSHVAIMQLEQEQFVVTHPLLSAI